MLEAETDCFQGDTDSKKTWLSADDDEGGRGIVKEEDWAPSVGSAGSSRFQYRINSPKDSYCCEQRYPIDCGPCYADVISSHAWKIGVRINFGCEFPFKAVPEVLVNALKHVEDMFGTEGDVKVVEHYRLGVECVRSNIDDPLCQLMLMIVLTISSSTETPKVAASSRRITAAARRKDPGQLALVMALRMCWHLYRSYFPWTKGTGGTAYDVSEMTKKIEHKGCNNRMLIALGWVVSTTSRDSPRNTDVRLRPAAELAEDFELLKAAMERPKEFIAIVYRDEDDAWVDRCASVIEWL